MGDFFFRFPVRPSFTEGVARILDFGDVLTEFRPVPSGFVADRQALQSDWRAVGEDVRFAVLEASQRRGIEAIKE